MHRISTQIFVATGLGVLVVYIGMSIFGYLAAFPFPRWVLRSSWLVPALRIVAWVPLLFLVAYSLRKLFAHRPILLSALIAVSGSITLAAQWGRYIHDQGFASVLQTIWPELVFLSIVFPLATAMANFAFERDAPKAARPSI